MQKISLFDRFKSLFGAQDMTVGKPSRILLRFAVPLLIGNFAQQMYSTVDSIVVGKFVGPEALAAVGVSSPIINMLLVLFMAISTGAGILVSQYFGARAKKDLSRCIGTSVALIFLSSILVTAVGIPLAEPLLRLIKTPESYLGMARSYLRIIFLGIVGMGFYNIVSGILRGLGDSIYPLIFLLVASALNIALDLWFVIGLKMGVAGTAWATILSQGISAILCLIRLSRMREIVSLNRRTLTPERAMGLRVMRLGLPSGITQAIFSMALILVQSLTNQMGELIPAVNVAVMRVDGFAMLPNFTFGLAMATYVGQNIGAGRRDRLKEGERSCLKEALGISLALVLLLLFFGRHLIGLFTNDAYVLDLGGRALRILAVGYVAMAIWQVYGGILRGAGDTASTMYISLITNVVIRVPLAYGLAYLSRSEAFPMGNPDVLFYSLAASWVLGAAVTYFWFRRGKWQRIDLIRQAAHA